MAMNSEPTKSTMGRADPLLTRAKLLTQATGAAFALSGAGWLAGCGSSENASPDNASPGKRPIGFGGIPVGSKDHPVKLPIYKDNQPIKPGLEPEAGPLEVFDWGAYVSRKVLKDFKAKYGVDVKWTTFATIDEAINKITSGAVQPDVWVPYNAILPRLVAGKLIQPINPDYIPNLSNVLPPLQSPYYDVNSQYTVPNYMWTNGIGWRNDLLPDVDPTVLDNPWDVFWETPAAKGKLSLQNAAAINPFEVGFHHIGLHDYTNFTKSDVDRALAGLQELSSLGLKLQYDAYQSLAEGTTVLSQAYGPTIIYAAGYLPKGTPSTVLSYWFPEDGRGPVNNDFWTIPKTSRHPVLAHLFLNHILTTQSGLDNFEAIGYQQPLGELSLERLLTTDVGDRYVLGLGYATPKQAVNGVPDPQMTPDQQLWLDQAFSKLSSGV